ncbi:MAG: caspase family protein [Pseudonocardiaceae bacterium]
MSQVCFPDPARSRALLIGASHFTAAGPDLPDIPAVQANLTALRQALTNPDTGVLRPDLCRVLADPGGVDEVGTALSELAATATDLLLVYYAGHGLVDDRGRLHLALAHTHPHRARWTAFPLELLREEIANSAAATRVLVLDCCFSGRAIEATADDQGVLRGQLEVAGTYTLTSTTANAPSHPPVGERYTAFTGALLRALDEADPLTLDQIHGVIDRDLTARNLPRPQRRAVNTAGNLALSRGPTTQPHTERTDSDTVRFTCPYRSPIKSGLLVCRTAFASIILLALEFLFLGSSVAFPTIPVIILSNIGVLIVAPRFAALCRSKNRETRGEELVIDRSGLTIRREGTTTYF